jgi:Domain of unknown function (DUF4249)
MMPKQYAGWLFFLLLVPASCQDVIELDLSDTDAQYVIEGAVTDQTGPFIVKIRQSVHFDEPNVYPEISGANVTIGDGSLSDTLREVRPGLYETVRLKQGIPGRAYALSVEIAGKTFKAVSQMPYPVPFEALTTTTGSFGGSVSILAVPNFTDPAGLGNHYRFVQWNNGRRLPNIFVLDDRNSDGLRITRPLFTPGGDVETVMGDTLTVEMQSIDRATYKYLYALDASAGNGPNAGVPANPENNFGGAALGYFSAHTTQRRTIIVQ